MYIPTNANDVYLLNSIISPLTCFALLLCFLMTFFLPVCIISASFLCVAGPLNRFLCVPRTSYMQLLNLLSFSAAIVIRASSLFLFYEEGLPALESSLQAPCYGTDVSAQSSTSSSSSSLSDVLVAAWSSVPTGCWGVATTVPDDAYASDDALATAWEASSYSDTYGAGDT